MDPDKWLEWAKRCEPLPEQEALKLLKYVKDILCLEATLLRLSCPITVCGDIHGQYYDLNQLFEIGGQVPSTKYLFLGDYVDRGHHSVESMTHLLALKARWPDRIFLLRGNHESKAASETYGFYDECLLKYGNVMIWRAYCNLFHYLPLAAIVDNGVFCVHAGLSPDLKTLQMINSINRFREVPHSGPFADLLWSDPDDEHNGFVISGRGAGYLFGRAVAERFLKENNLKMICRSHQMVMEGHSFMWDNTLVTVWSAPNYCYRCNNKASIMEIGSCDSYEMKTFGPSPLSHSNVTAEQNSEASADST